MSLIYEKIDRCRTRDCPWKDDEEIHCCWGKDIPGHVCSGVLTHQHWPKKGMGGNNPESKIRAILCWSLHDQIDNGIEYGNAAYTIDGERWFYHLWRVGDPMEQLLHREIPQPTKSGRSRGSQGRSDDVHDVTGADGVAASMSRSKREDAGSSPAPSATFDAWYARMKGLAAEFATLKGGQTSYLWAVGDELNYGEQVFGEEWSQAQALFEHIEGMGPGRLGNVMRVCERFAPERRNHPNLSFSHFEVVGSRNLKLNAEDQDAWLERANKGRWKVRELRKHLYGERKETVYTCPKCGHEGARSEFKP